MRLVFCGVRGSTGAPGAEFARIGGHTSCVAVAHDGAPWSLVLDAGTGIRRVTDYLDGDAFAGTIMLTHLHWDHVQGLPFFAAGDRDDSHVRVLIPDQAISDQAISDQAIPDRAIPDRAIPDQEGPSVVDVLARAMSPPHFPIGPDGLRGEWEFDALAPGTHAVEGFEVTAFDVPHKGGRTYGFRIDDGDASVAYIPDHLPDEGSLPEIARVCAGVDLLVHDAQFLEPERAVADLYGHATVDDAVNLARRAGARTLALFHHSPARRDEEVEAIGVAASGQGVEVIVAREQAVVQLGSRAADAHAFRERSS